jgi:hypothetical protein
LEIFATSNIKYWHLSISFRKEILEDLLKNICLSTFRCQITTELNISLIWKLVQRWPKLKFNQKTLDFASQFPNVTDEQFIKYCPQSFCWWIKLSSHFNFIWTYSFLFDQRIFTVAHCAVHLDLSYCRNLTSDILPFLRLRPLQVVKLNFVEVWNSICFSNKKTFEIFFLIFLYHIKKLKMIHFTV